VLPRPNRPPEAIYETVVTTRSAMGSVHVAPMGARFRGSEVLLMPFKPSTTLGNIEATGFAVLNTLTDVRVFAGCVTGRRDWPTLPLTEPAGFSGVRLACALGHAALKVVAIEEDPQRPLLRLQRIHEVQHIPFAGMNRAQAAVVEGAVLVSRLHLLPAERIDTEFKYLQIAIDRSAGPQEIEAFGWLREAIEKHRGGAAA
jgi:uncharacterized protein